MFVKFLCTFVLCHVVGVISHSCILPVVSIWCSERANLQLHDCKNKLHKIDVNQFQNIIIPKHHEKNSGQNVTNATLCSLMKRIVQTEEADCRLKQNLLVCRGGAGG